MTDITLNPETVETFIEAFIEMMISVETGELSLNDDQSEDGKTNCFVLVESADPEMIAEFLVRVLEESFGNVTDDTLAYVLFNSFIGLKDSEVSYRMSDMVEAMASQLETMPVEGTA